MSGFVESVGGVAAKSGNSVLIAHGVEGDVSLEDIFRVLDIKKRSKVVCCGVFLSIQKLNHESDMVRMVVYKFNLRGERFLKTVRAGCLEET